jgi:DNA-binding SARP family transcriptional activator
VATEFRILGPLEVVEDGHVLDVGGAKQRALLAMLLLHANEVVSTDRLIDALWEDAPPNRAHKALQVYVSQLRKLLGRERLETKTPGYLLRVAPDELDVARFERLIADGKQAEALALWRGQPLSDFAFSRFTRSEIARLEELRLAALEERIDADLVSGRHAAVAGELEALVQMHPLRERIRGQLMLALYRSGRQAEALEVYQDGRRTLTEELGIEPAKELRELEKAILLQDPGLDVQAVEAAGRPGRRSVFVGRESEVEQLAFALEDALGGQGRIVLMSGEPGIGKSRLCDEAINRARARGARTLAGRCWEAGGAPAYWPWVQALRTYVRDVDDDVVRSHVGADASEIVQMLPELRHLVPDLPDVPSAESESARFRLFDATATFLTRAAAAQPLVLALDDLHAADTPSLLMLEFLAGEIDESRILILGAFRDVDPTLGEPLTATLAALGRKAVTTRLALHGLAVTEVRDFIDCTEGVAASKALVEAIHDETEGNPLFVGEVVRLLAQEGLLEGGRDEVERLGVPGGVREVIGRRLSHLSRSCRHVLTLASVLGREFAFAALEQLSGRTLEQLLEDLDEAMSARIVGEAPGSPGQLRFAHALIRDTIYEELTPVRRIGLHRLAGEALEKLYAEDPDPHLAEIAHHFFDAAAGGEVERAVDYARRAGDHAMALLAYEEAARLYQQGLLALGLKEPVDLSTRCELMLGLGDARARGGHEEDARATFLEAADIARLAGTAEQLARAALGYGGRFVWMPSIAAGMRAVELLEEALLRLGKAESALRAMVLARLAGALRDHREPERRNALSAEAVAIARRLDDASTLAYVLDGRYAAIWGPANAAERVPIAAEILELAEQVGDRERAIQARFYRAFAVLELGWMQEVYAELGAMEALADDLRQPAQYWYVTVLRAILALFEGRFDEAERLIPKALEFAQTMRIHMPVSAYRIQMGALRREQGRPDEVLAEMELEVEESTTIDSDRCNLADLYTHAGREAEAREVVEGLAGDDFDIRVDNDKIFGWCLLAEICFLLKDGRHASRLYELLLPYADCNAVGHPLWAAGSVSRYLGLLAAQLGRFDGAARHLEHALEANERMRARPWFAHTQEDYGRLLIFVGDEDRGHALVEQALATYRELGMDGPLRRIEGEAA